MEHQIDFKFTGNNVMFLKYYMTVRRFHVFSGDEQTVRNRYNKPFLKSKPFSKILTSDKNSFFPENNGV